MGSIVIVGLGPGDSRYLTREAWQVLTGASDLYVRTTDHPVVEELPAHLTVHGFDSLYANSADFTTVYTMIVDRIVELGRRGPIVYAVPGHPFVGEATVRGVLHSAEKHGIPVRLVEGLSFVEPVLAALRRDGLDGLQLHDAIEIARFKHPPLNPDMPVLLGQVYSRLMAGDLKLTLSRIYPETHTVKLIHAAGSAAAEVETVPLYAIDRSKQIRNLTCLFIPPRPATSSLASFAETIAYLRSPDGCPWDRAQTPQSMRSGFIEEVAEAIDALDRGESAELCDELGDVLLHIVFQAQIAAESGEFTLADIIERIDAKIRRRHPHVWGDAVIENADDLNKSWEAIKAEEQGSTPQSTLDNIAGALPALLRAQKIQKRVKRVGFDWPSINGVWHKLLEEIDELQQADSAETRHAELGDLLFTIVNLARWLDVDAEIALRDANQRFATRFQMVEQSAKARGTALTDLSLDQIDAHWQQAKQTLTESE